jgi:raffinose/stachyose/melibiose transport system permease protein
MKYNNGNGGLMVQNSFLKIFNYFLLTLAIFAIFAPMLILFVISFKTDKEYIYSQFYQLPESFTNLFNYRQVFVRANMFQAFYNTLRLCISSTIIGVIMASMTSYVLSRFKFRFKNLILALFVIATVIPNVTTLVATYSLIKSLGLMNKIGAGILLYSVLGVLEIYIFLEFINKIPVELDESAMIDGASYFRIYRSIIIPQLTPAIITVVILRVLNVYNDFIIPYIYMPRQDLKTISLALMRFSQDKVSQWNLMAAGIIVVMLPTVILYMFAQKYIIAGVTEGAVKS